MQKYLIQSIEKYRGFKMKIVKTIAIALIPVVCAVVFLFDLNNLEYICNIILVMHFVWPIAMPLIIAKVNKTFTLQGILISLLSIFLASIILTGPQQIINFSFESDLEYLVMLLPMVEAIIVCYKLFNNL